ncbi:MAG: DMT family transporter [Planctomycetes bacterium]|nr:DMT family transporter [Planctomycetota bacterium]
MSEVPQHPVPATLPEMAASAADPLEAERAPSAASDVVLPARGLSGLGFMALSVVFFSGMGVCIKLLGKDIPATEKILVRSVATLPVLFVMLRRRGLSPWGNNRKLLFLRGALGTLGMWAYFASIAALPLGNAILLTHTSPIFSALVAWWALKERPPRGLLWASCACLVGVAFVARPTPTAPLLASAIAFLSAIGNGATYTTVRATAKYDHHLVVVFWLPLVCAPISALLVLGAWVAPTPAQWGWLLLMTLLSIVAQICMTIGMQRETASRSTNMLFLGVVLAMLWGQALGDPPLGWPELLGAAGILGGIVGLNAGRLRRIARA